MPNARLLFVLLLLPCVAGPAKAAGVPAGRPNIVFILSDDQRWDTMGCAGNRVIHTPHLDRLAADGVRFRNAFVTTAICAASRASILTGLYERTHRYTFNTPPIRTAHVRDSYPAVLKRAGYRTGFVGKFGVAVEGQKTTPLFDSFVPLNRTPYLKKQPDGTERHLTDLEADAAVRFLDAVKPGEAFCLSVSFNAPHAEDNDPQQYVWTRDTDGLYANDVITPPASMTADVFHAQQPFLQTSESRVRFNWRFDEPAKYQSMVKGYFRMISGVDAAVGRIRAALADRALADDTVIVYTSDNGYFLGERGFADKWYLYEPSVRVPLIVHDPRAKNAGRTVDAVALNVDVAPTLLDLAGVSAPDAYQGRSLRPLLAGDPPSDWRTDFFYEHLFDRANIPKSEGVRGPRFTYVRWFEQRGVPEELYDRDADPEELTNLVANPSHAETLAAMRRRTDELRDRYGGVFVPHPKPVKPAGPKPAGE